MNVICFDLEGPLSPQDNAYELMKLFPNGDKVFEIISRYDDLLTLEGKEGYEPGDTLALIAPFLVYHKLKEKDIISLAEKANLTPGAFELISQAKSQGWQVFCISTSYEQYALRITQRLDIPTQNVKCTRFPLDQFSQLLCKEDFALLEQTEGEILGMRPFSDDGKIKRNLNLFYWEKLPQSKLGMIIKQIKPIGGQRKVEALEQFAQTQKQPLPRWVVIGDSITDFKMLQRVNEAGGLAIAYNANEYALPYSTMGLASVDLTDLSEVLETWETGKRPATENLVKSKEKVGGNGDRAYFHWLADTKNIAAPLEIHKRIRRLVREEAAKLG